MGPLSIRAARRADVATLARLNAVVQSLHASLYPDLFLPPSAPATRAYFEAVVESPATHIRIARWEEIDVGYTVWRHERRPQDAFTRAFDAVYLEQIAVAPESRRGGIGTALMQDMAQAAERLGARTLVLDTWVDNLEAQAFFEAQGFCRRRTVLWRDATP